MVTIRDSDVPAMERNARDFLEHFEWCRKVTNVRLGMADAGVLAVFRCDIEPAQRDVDNQLWVVVGDVPPAYIVVDENPTWQDALDSYVWLMQQWVDAARNGSSVEDLIPVNVPPTVEYAEMLQSRLDVIRGFLAQFEDSD